MRGGTLRPSTARQLGADAGAMQVPGSQRMLPTLFTFPRDMSDPGDLLT